MIKPYLGEFHFMRPDIMTDGWHFECSCHWQSFGLAVMANWGESYVLRVGPLCVMFWFYESDKWRALEGAK